MMLEDLTENIIRKFVHYTFHSRQGFHKHVDDPCYTFLVDEAVRRADGVFQWVFLVCKPL